MPEKDIQVVLARLDGLRELITEKLDRNDSDHKAMSDHLVKLNGQTAKNTTFRNRSVGIYVGVSSAVGAIFMITGLIISVYI